MFRKIDLNADSMIRGFEKCARVRPLVVPDISTEKGASYLVRRSDGATFALVMFARAPSGCAIAKCDCPAGAKDINCYHVAAALLVHCGLVRAGLRVAVSRSFWERESANVFKHSLLPPEEKPTQFPWFWEKECPHCGKKLTADENQTGKCRGCGKSPFEKPPTNAPRDSVAAA